MSTSELDVMPRRTAEGRPPVRHVSGGRTVPRRRPARARVALCPDPVPRPAPPAVGLIRRVAATAGLVLASAAAVVGLGLLADAAASAPDRAPAPEISSLR